MSPRDIDAIFTPPGGYGIADRPPADPPLDVGAIAAYTAGVERAREAYRKAPSIADYKHLHSRMKR